MQETLHTWKNINDLKDGTVAADQSGQVNGKWRYQGISNFQLTFLAQGQIIHLVSDSTINPSENQRMQELNGRSSVLTAEVWTEPGHSTGQRSQT